MAPLPTYALAYDHLKDILLNQGIQVTIEELAQTFRPAHLQKGATYLHAGDIEHRIAFLHTGFLRYFYITYDGHDVTKHFAMAGDFACSYASMIYHKPSAYDIVAEEDCQLLTIDVTSFKTLIEQDRRFERIARLYTEAIYNIKEMREAALLTQDATSRYIDFCKQYPGLESRMRQRHIATYLGIHPVSLSRIKKEIAANSRPLT